MLDFKSYALLSTGHLEEAIAPNETLFLETGKPAYLANLAQIARELPGNARAQQALDRIRRALPREI